MTATIENPSVYRVTEEIRHFTPHEQIDFLKRWWDLVGTDFSAVYAHRSMGRRCVQLGTGKVYLCFSNSRGPTSITLGQGNAQA